LLTAKTPSTNSLKDYRERVRYWLGTITPYVNFNSSQESLSYRPRTHITYITFAFVHKNYTKMFKPTMVLEVCVLSVGKNIDSIFNPEYPIYWYSNQEKKYIKGWFEEHYYGVYPWEPSEKGPK